MKKENGNMVFRKKQILFLVKQIFYFMLVVTILSVYSLNVFADSLTVTPKNGDEVYPGSELEVTYTTVINDERMPYISSGGADFMLYKGDNWDRLFELSLTSIDPNTGQAMFSNTLTATDELGSYSFKVDFVSVWYELPDGVLTNYEGNYRSNSFAPTVAGAQTSITIVNRVLTLSIASIDFGGIINPVVKYGEQIIEDGYTIRYKKLGDSEYSESVPTEAGSYEAIVSRQIPNSTNSETATTTFVIREIEEEEETTEEQKEGSGSISVPSFDYNSGKVTPTVSSSTNGTDHVKIEYKVSGAADNTYTTTAPTLPGKYVARASFDETDTYKAVQVTTEFEIRKAVATATVTAANVYYGVVYTPQSTTTMQSPKPAVYEYKTQGSADTSYTTTKPTAVGNYTVRVTYPETEYYKAATATANYAITYMPAPKYYLNGTAGKNGFYTTNVEITTQDGYKLCSEANGNFTDNILITDTNNISKLYFMDVATGARSDAVTFAPIKIDTVKPQYSGAPEVAKYYGDFLGFAIADLNLLTITVNGENVEFDGETVDLNLDADGGYKDYDIIVTDKAGNINRLTFTLAAEWLETGIIPADKEVSLESGTKYQFESGGTWQMEGDDTEYAGGTSFYIKSDGRHTFTNN